MKVEIHTLANSSVDSLVLNYHSKVFNYFGYSPIYSKENIYEGGKSIGPYYNRIMQSTTADIVIFSDVDAVPINDVFYEEIIKYCSNDYMIGVTQVTPNANSTYEFYCASAFMGISKSYYESMGCPTFMDDILEDSDISQQVTKKAMQMKKRIKLWFPSSFQAVPKGGLWRYGGYGYNGIGSIYDEKIYHLFESRLKSNVDLFVDSCDKILAGTPEKIKRTHLCTGEYLNTYPINMDYGRN